MTAPTIDDIKGWTILEKMRDGFTKICNYLKGVPTVEDVGTIVEDKLVEVVEPVLEPVMQTVDRLNTHMTEVDSDILTLKNKDAYIIDNLKINNGLPDGGFVFEGYNGIKIRTGAYITSFDCEDLKNAITSVENNVTNHEDRINNLDSKVDGIENKTINTVNNQTNKTGLEIVGTDGLVETTTQDNDNTVVSIGLSTATKTLLQTISNDITNLKKKPDYEAFLTNDKLKQLKRKDYIYYRGNGTYLLTTTGVLFEFQGFVNEVTNSSTGTDISIIGTTIFRMNNAIYFYKIDQLRVNNDNTLSITYSDENAMLKYYFITSGNGCITKYNGD